MPSTVVFFSSPGAATPHFDCLFGAIIPMDIPGIEPEPAAHKTAVLTIILYVLTGFYEFPFSMCIERDLNPRVRTQ